MVEWARLQSTSPCSYRVLAHVVRHPLKVLSSSVAFGQCVECWVHIDEFTVPPLAAPRNASAWDLSGATRARAAARDAAAGAARASSIGVVPADVWTGRCLDARRPTLVRNRSRTRTAQVHRREPQDEPGEEDGRPRLARGVGRRVAAGLRRLLALLERHDRARRRRPLPDRTRGLRRALRGRPTPKILKLFNE